MIEFKKVNKAYSGKYHALRGVDLKIQDGEFVFIVGASGAGKSTLIKMLLHEEVPTSGEVYVNNYDIVKMKDRDIPYLRRTMGVVFQDFRLIENKTVFENVAFAMRVTGSNGKTIKSCVNIVLKLVDLSTKANKKPNELSGGEQQRVAFARALVNSPKLIIADEPTGNLDPNLSYELMQLLLEINRRGTTVLVVTHEHNMVRMFNERIVCLEDGRIIADTKNGA